MSRERSRVAVEQERRKRKTVCWWGQGVHEEEKVRRTEVGKRKFLCVCVLEWLTFELGPDWCLELSPFASGSLSAHFQH